MRLCADPQIIVGRLAKAAYFKLHPVLKVGSLSEIRTLLGSQSVPRPCCLALFQWAFWGKTRPFGLEQVRTSVNRRERGASFLTRICQLSPAFLTVQAPNALKRTSG